ncbi:VOC family protein [Nocardia sp. BMG111209]|uniref:VOC family protein n=1 Tax=Nocardia sp. BMG111209 TaxID=1160137 RepID=UPI0003620567|nr:VOC family protein [Nocardia sp. BMG111209]
MTTFGDVHEGLHADGVALRGEHPGRHPNPVVKVVDLAWLEFGKPDLTRTAAFAADFGFTPVLHTADELHLRGTHAGPPCVVVRRAARSAFLGPAFRAATADDVRRFAEAAGVGVEPLPETLGGVSATTRDPGGARVRVVTGCTEHPALPAQPAWTDHNTGDRLVRINRGQRAPREAASIERLGHVVLQSDRYLEALNWYLAQLGLIVSDFLYYPGQRDRGPVMSFLRCDRGDTPSDHHTLALMLGPANRYVHSAYQVRDLDVLAAGGEYLRERGYRRSWGIGRHIQGSQIFDYWRDPDGLIVEHFTDGDRFDRSVAPGWAPMSASGLAQWGPPATADFLGTPPSPRSLGELRSIVSALRCADNEFDTRRLLGFLKVANS